MNTSELGEIVASLLTDGYVVNIRSTFTPLQTIAVSTASSLPFKTMLIVLDIKLGDQDVILEDL